MVRGEISTTIGCIAIKFATDISSLEDSSNYFDDTLQIVNGLHSAFIQSAFHFHSFTLTSTQQENKLQKGSKVRFKIARSENQTMDVQRQLDEV